MMNSRPLLSFLLISLFVCFDASFSYAESAKTERQVTVQGRGQVFEVPDLARLWVRVTEDGTRVDAVTQQVRHKMETVLKTLKAQGVADKDIQTQVYQVTPKIEWKSGRSTRIGYTASNQLEVKVHDLKKTGSILAAVLDAGANDVTGPQFGFENPQEHERKALGLALSDAKAKAALLAQAAGAQLGAPLRIEESGIQRPGPRPMMAMRAHTEALAATAEPIASGEETLEAVVTASFELK